MTRPAPDLRILVDADACPVKDEIFRVATRCGLRVLLVANGPLRVPRNPLFESVVVARDRSTFLQRLDDLVQALRRHSR